MKYNNSKCLFLLFLLFLLSTFYGINYSKLLNKKPLIGALVFGVGYAQTLVSAVPVTDTPDWSTTVQLTLNVWPTWSSGVVP